MTTIQSYRALFYRTWDSLRESLILVVGLTATVLIIGFICSFIPLVGGLLTGALYLGYLHCLVKISRKQDAQWVDLFYFYTNMTRFLQALILGGVVQLGAILGFLLLIVPGVWFVVASMYANAIFVAEGSSDSIAAVRRSLAVVKGAWWNHAGLLIFIGLLNVLGAFVLMIGLLVTIPISALMLFEVISPQQNLSPASGQADLDQGTASESSEADQLKLF